MLQQRGSIHVFGVPVSWDVVAGLKFWGRLLGVGGEGGSWVARRVQRSERKTPRVVETPMRIQKRKMRVKRRNHRVKK